MRRVFAVVLPCAGVTLLGCGGGGDDPAPTPAPSPAPAPPAKTPVQKAWDNHFAAFGEQNLDMIMQDYDENSTIAIFNDVCDGGATRKGYAEYQGASIRGFFDALFKQLGKPPKLSRVGPENGGPVVQSGDGPLGDVFLTWASPETGIDLATDSFSWKMVDGAAMVRKQTIVVTEPGKTDCASGGNTVAAPKTGEPLYTGWDNHFNAFGGQDLTKIMLDYTDESVVQVWDNTANAFSRYSTTTAIQGMFKQLFRDINVGNPSGGSETVAVPIVEVEIEFDHVFLVWTSSAFPQATDTFTFNSAGKIIRQNIVVSSNITNPGTAAASSVEMV